MSEHNQITELATAARMARVPDAARAFSSARPPWPGGVHYLLELSGCPGGLLDDVSHIQEALHAAAAAGRCTVLQVASNHFAPQGVTAIALLAESHLSIHTWPEHGYAAVDLFTCGTATDPDAACALLVERLGAERHRLQVLQRGNAD